MARMNSERVRQVAEFLKANPPEGEPLNFYSVQTPKGELVLDTLYPSLNRPQAIDFFFFTIMHDFGFWYGDHRGYVSPMYGSVNGKKLKGSDLLWTLFTRRFKENPEMFRPEFLATISPDDLATLFFKDDIGTQWPDFDVRFSLSRAYGRWFVKNGTSPLAIVQKANASAHPLMLFLSFLGEIPGYNEDQWEKKNMLLAMALANRPEHFLNITDTEDWAPIVDYHIMRLCLRLGLVELTEGAVTLMQRRWADPKLEADIRAVCYRAVQWLIRESGLPMPLLDMALWMGRKYCPEMTEPECVKCVFDSVCAKYTKLFQPVLRTTAY